MYLIDANIFLEVIYRRDKWAECYEFLNRIKKGDIRPTLFISLYMPYQPFWVSLT
ncbi:hypothetical protein [Vulcanisaeta sp. JCM 16159]|uniref:hypothetical protein n=1 Tax=Vulcanisaeta sp. JCM 16159 TaxID=1295371 RepID=UPI000AEC090F|nr:hypothetical protein [Vulcanisaeta sp. JCM 16159]